jgi:hypothetical protein
MEDDAGSDTSGDISAIAAVVTKHVVPKSLKATLEDLAPLTVPHLYWRCSVNGHVDPFPTTFKALIISDAFVNSLGLKRRKLHDPMAVELAIPESGVKRIC